MNCGVGPDFANAESEFGGSNPPSRTTTEPPPVFPVESSSTGSGCIRKATARPQSIDTLGWSRNYRSMGISVIFNPSRSG
jgi:hypothetical protein